MNRTWRLVAMFAALGATAARADSLYVAGTFRPLAADIKAFRVGDVLTVQVFESSTASTTTDTTTRRKNDLGASFGNVNTGRQFGGTLSVNGDFEGGGATERSNKLLATLTVSVREVLPSGDLKVEGEQVLTVNEEQHLVRVEGRVRPQDISSDNVVLSTRLADARIHYLGDGDLSERQKRGWWRRLVDWLGF